MKIGAVIGICTDRDPYQRECIDSIRSCSESGTIVVAIFNGIVPFPVAPGVETMYFPERLGRERGLWKLAFKIALERGWDWCFDFHDDFKLLEPGWEAVLQDLDRRYRLGVAAWTAWNRMGITGPPGSRSFDSGGRDFLLGTAVDGCGFGWNMHLFKRRGKITFLDAELGYGEADTGLWALNQGWACANIRTAWEHRKVSSSTRMALNIPAEGLNEVLEAHLDDFPAIATGDHEVMLGGKVVHPCWAHRGPASRYINVIKPSYDGREAAAVAKVLQSAWTGSGPEVAAFEREFAEYLGVEARHVIAVNSCTAALHLALVAAPLDVHKLAPPARVAVPPLTFASTAHAVLHAKRQITFVDVDARTLCLDPGLVKGEILNARADAAIPVHLYGSVADMEAFWSLGIPIIEDCAHAAGARYANGKKVGSDRRSFAACFSFNAVKNVSTGDGGMIVCQDDAVSARIRRLRWCGIDTDTFQRAKTGGWRYDITECGFKYQLTDLIAAIGRVQLVKLDGQNAKRRVLVEQYKDGLADVPWIEFVGSRGDPSWHRFTIKVPAEWRDDLIAYLRYYGIESGVYYTPVNLFSTYSSHTEATPVAHQEAKRIISLPLFPDLYDLDVNWICEAVRSFPTYVP